MHFRAQPVYVHSDSMFAEWDRLHGRSAPQPRRSSAERNALAGALDQLVESVRDPRWEKAIVDLRRREPTLLVRLSLLFDDYPHALYGFRQAAPRAGAALDAERARYEKGASMIAELASDLGILGSARRALKQCEHVGVTINDGLITETRRRIERTLLTHDADIALAVEVDPKTADALFGHLGSKDRNFVMKTLDSASFPITKTVLAHETNVLTHSR